MPSDETKKRTRDKMEHISIQDIERSLLFRCKEAWERQLHPNGAKIETYVDCHSSSVPFPQIGLTLYANGTWEYTVAELNEEDA